MRRTLINGCRSSKSRCAPTRSRSCAAGSPPALPGLYTGPTAPWRRTRCLLSLFFRPFGAGRGRRLTCLLRASLARPGCCRRHSRYGAVLCPDDPAGIVATGFLATGPCDESSLRDIREDSIDREIGRYLHRDDVVTTVMSTFVSTTAHCARCHDHKFDPISQEEYYSLQAVFAGTDKGNRPYDPDPEMADRRRRLTERKRRLGRRGDAVDVTLADTDL